MVWSFIFFFYLCAEYPNQANLEQVSCLKVDVRKVQLWLFITTAFNASVLTVNCIFISTSFVVINLQSKVLSANFSLASFIYKFEH